MSNYPYKAFIFDMDGVITKTASLHFKAWKIVFDEYLKLVYSQRGESFEEFTEEDYLTYVDGKPRYKGVESFLSSRDISLAWGSPQDSEDKDTICGIGNRKNKVFLSLIEKEEVEIYPSTVTFIKELKKRGIKVGVASSSKSCRYILERIGIYNIFDCCVDGVVSEKLSLRGKPEGDIFLVAARYLGIEAKESVVLEDASSGVEAGRNAGFPLVIGVARKENIKELLGKGADIVIKDLEALKIDEILRWKEFMPPLLKEVWADVSLIKEHLNKVFKDKKVYINSYYITPIKDIVAKRDPVFFLDYDGTLTPIVKRPELANLSPEMKVVLEKLSKRFIVSVVSGRSIENVKRKAGIEHLYYAGNHGFEIEFKDKLMVYPQANKVVPLIKQLKEKTEQELKDISGLIIEEKKFSFALHYRLVSDKDIPRIEELAKKIVEEHSELRLMQGKKVFEIMPSYDWDKAKAVRWLMETLGISWDKATIIYIGDDITDEDAFRFIKSRGLGILVSSVPKDSAASCRVEGPWEVKEFLEKFINL